MNDVAPDSGHDEPQPSQPSNDEVRAQLDQILASPEFSHSARVQKFFRFVIEETLGGREDSLKEYSIAIDVFDRDESFDPQLSSIVRVEASRLRKKIEHYYAVEGQEDPIRITLPTGTYVPEIRRVDLTPDTASISSERTENELTHNFPWIPAAFVAVALVLLVAVVVRMEVTSVVEQTEANRAASQLSLAVLPLRNLVGDPEQEYFSDGITESLISGIAKNSDVRVISRTSVMQFKNVEKPIAEIARELGVSHVIEGSVLRADNRLRINVQLIEAQEDHMLWSETYVRRMADVLSLQDEVVRRVVESLSDQTSLAGVQPITVAPDVNLDAFESVLKGRFFLNQFTKTGFDKGIEYFQEAINTAPNYAEAYSGFASCHCLIGGHGFELVKPHEGMPIARQAALEAIELDGSLAEPYAFLGMIQFKYEWDWATSENTLIQSIELNPSYAQARLFYSFYLEAMGRQEEAISQAEIAKQLDPLSFAANVNLGWQYLQAGRLEQARNSFEAIGEFNPNFWGMHWGLGHYYRALGDYENAISSFQTATNLDGGHVLPQSALGYTYAISGRQEESRRIIDSLKALASETYVSPFVIATVYVGLGDNDQAIEWLEKAYETRARSVAWLNVSKEYESLRTDPRFNSLLQRIGHVN